MASYTTVTDIYNTVCDALLEPYQSGLYPGLSLGITTEADFLQLFSVVLEDFCNRTGLSWSIFTTQINYNVSTYQFPEFINEPKLAFVNGQYIDHSDLFSLDDWIYQWQGQTGTPQFWYSDGLPPKTIGVAANPNYSGASYVIPTGPSPAPPYGVTNLFNGATPGYYTGIVNFSGTTGTYLSGALFDTNWSSNYYPAPSMVLTNLSGTQTIPIQNVTSNVYVTLTSAPGDGAYSFAVNIGQDGNLSIVGTTGLSSITYTLDMLVPVLPDSLASVYLAYGILARIWSTEGEQKDLQRSYYAQARYNEGIALASAVSGELINVG